MDYIALGPAPVEEECVQVGDEDYYNKALAECRRYKAQLNKQFPQLSEIDSASCRLVIKSFVHDFGSYMEVCILYDPEDTDALNLAYLIEGELPERWTP